MVRPTIGASTTAGIGYRPHIQVKNYGRAQGHGQSTFSLIASKAAGRVSRAARSKLHVRMGASSEELRIRRLLDVGRELVTELDLGVVLDRVLQTGREITGARYAALGVLNEQRTELEQFLTSGVDEQTERAIGALPRGRGVLGELIEHPVPLRLTDVSEHHSSYGFPAGHP